MRLKIFINRFSRTLSQHSIDLIRKSAGEPLGALHKILNCVCNAILNIQSIFFPLRYPNQKATAPIIPQGEIANVFQTINDQFDDLI